MTAFTLLETNGGRTVHEGEFVAFYGGLLAKPTDFPDCSTMGIHDKKSRVLWDIRTDHTGNDARFIAQAGEDEEPNCKVSSYKWFVAQNPRKRKRGGNAGRKMMGTWHVVVGIKAAKRVEPGTRLSVE